MRKKLVINRFFYDLIYVFILYHNIPSSFFFKQYLLIPIKTRIKNKVDAKLKGKNGNVNHVIPVKTRLMKFKKVKPGFIYSLVNSELLGKLNNAKINRGVIWRR